jgi:hypothetical protein
MPTVAKFATLKLNFTGDHTLVPLGAYDCSLRLCIKTWTDASFQNSSFEEALPMEFDFQTVTHAQPEESAFSTLQIDSTLNATRFGTHMINMYDWVTMADFLGAQFSYR